MAIGLEEIREFWEQHPVGHAHVGPQPSWYDYFREFDNLREHPDIEPYAFSNFIHGYEESSGTRVLDYGCGNGYVLSRYARCGAEVVGVDITARAIELCEKRFDLMGLTGTFVQNDGRSIPFESESFDIVCSIGVLHHIPDPAPVVAELCRVLKPGGKIVVMMYHRDSFRYRVTFRWRRHFQPFSFRARPLDEEVNRNDGEGNPFGRVYSREELRELLRDFEQHAFWVNKLGLDELALFSRRLRTVFVRLLPQRVHRALAARFGWNLYCIARKPLRST